MQFSGFIGPSYTLDSRTVSCQRCVNLFPQLNEAAGKNGEVAALRRTPGLELLSTAGAGGNRGNFTSSNGRAFAVNGTYLYEISTPSAPVLRGTLQTSVGQVGIDDNGVQMLIVDGLKGYVFTFSNNSFLQISDPDFPVASHCCFIDQYLIVNDVNSRRFYLSSLSDATDWDGLDFASKEGSPDNVLAIVADHRELFLIGDTTSEVWQDVGDADFPFIRVQGAFMEFGTSSPYAVKKLDSGVIFPHQDKNGQGMVMRISGYNGQRISTHAVEKAISEGDLINATAWTYQMDGHSFYVLNVPGLRSTWVYDVSTNLWHERDSWTTNGFTRNRAENHCMVDGVHVVGNYQNGKLYKMNKSLITEDSEDLVWERTFPHLSKEMKRVTVNSLSIDAEVGIGMAGGATPVALLTTSRDGGKTYGSEKSRSTGKTGEYKTQMIWNRLGQGRDWVFKLRGSGPITLVSAFIDAKAMKN
jgi:hypothetical protein